MPTVQKSLRLPETLVREIDKIARSIKKDFSAVTNDLLEEAIRAHQCPGIVFTEGVSGKRARIAGTGIEVWELIAVYNESGENAKRLREAFSWLTEQQLNSALGYYARYRNEIDTHIAENERWTAESIGEAYPFLRVKPK